METKLETIYDGRNSFYGKARIEIEGNIITLISYSTEVALINTKKNIAFVKGMYSQTTLRHIKEFLLQYGFKAETWKQIEADYRVWESE